MYQGYGSDKLVDLTAWVRLNICPFIVTNSCFI